MKLLFDEHISFRSVRALHDIFPEAKHVKFFHLEQELDSKIWQFAKEEEYTIVTKDDDFHQRSLTQGHPPKIIWLKLQNSNRSEVESFIRSKASIIEQFIKEGDQSLLILTKEK